MTILSLRKPAPAASKTATPDRSEPTAIDPMVVRSPKPKLYTLNFAIAFVAQCLFVLANTLMAHYARYIEYLGGGLFDVGMINGLAPVLGLAARPWIGEWIDRLGARNMWIVGELVFIGSTAANLLVHEMGPALYLIRIAQVMGVALFFASGLTYIMQVAPPGRKAEAIGIFGCSGFMGIATGPFLGDLILGPAASRTWSSFAWLFGTAAGAVLTSLVFTMFVRPAPGWVRPTGRSVTLKSFVTKLQRHWPGMILLINVTFGLAMAIPFVFLSKFADDLGLSTLTIGPITAGAVGVFFVIYGSWGLLMRLTIGRSSDGMSREKVLLFGLSTFVAGSLIMTWVDVTSPGWLIVAALLLGTGHALVFHTMISLSVETFPPEASGTGSALAIMALDVGTISGPPALAWLIDQYGYPSAFLAIAICHVMAGCIFAYVKYAAGREVRGDGV